MPTNILATDRWLNELAALVGCIGDNQFSREVAEACQFITGYQTTLIVAFSEDKRPIHVFDNLPSEHTSKSLSPYFEGAYLIDPFYALYTNNAPDGIYQLKDTAPDGFTESEYFKSYYAATQLTDESSIFITIANDTRLLISLGNRETPKVKSGQIAKLQAIVPILKSLCVKHQQFMSLRQGEQTDSKWLMGAPLDRAFKNFGKDHLSKRECEVIQLLLKGHSNKSIARLLDISVDTVKVYNKRFHTKLNISSQAELFSLFLESISMVPIDSDIDPLTHYFEITA